MAGRARRPPSAATPSAPEEGGGGVRVPNTNTDPVMSWGLFPVEVTFANHGFEIPATTALEWLTLLMNPDDFDPLAIFPGLLSDEDQDLVWDLMFERDIGVTDLGEMSLLAIAAAAGRPWWVAMRLVATVAQNQHTLGAEMLMRGADATKLSLSGWLDVALLVAMRNQSKSDATMFSMKLEMPPPDVAKDQPEPEISMDQFMSMA